MKANDYEVDITGYWDNRYRFQVTVDDFQPKPMPMTAQAKAIYEGRTFGDDHVLRCLPPGLPRIFGSPYPMQIVDAGIALLDGVHAGQHAAARLDGRPLAAGGAAADVDGLLDRQMGRPHARHRDDDAAAGLARRLGLPDERRRRHAHRRALDARGRRPDDGAAHDRPRQAATRGRSSARAARSAATPRSASSRASRATRGRSTTSCSSAASSKSACGPSSPRPQSYSVYLRASPRTRSAGYLRSFCAILSSAARSRSTSSRSANRSK